MPVKKKAASSVRRRKKVSKKKKILNLPDEIDQYNEKLDKNIAKKKKKTKDKLADRDKYPSHVTRVTVTASIAERYAAFAAKHKDPDVKKYSKGNPEKKFKKGMSVKTAAVLLSDTIKNQGRKPPKLHLWKRDPGSDFVLEMYKDISQWSKEVLYNYIEALTGKRPDMLDLPFMLGEAKRLFHETFRFEMWDYGPIQHHNSVWKIWPHCVYRKEKMSEEGSKRATKKKAGSKKATAKASKKKVSAKKKATKKKASKKVSKKKAVSKKVAAKKSSVPDITKTTKLRVVKDSGVPKKDDRKNIKEVAAKSKAGIGAGKLMEKTGCTLRTISAMIGKGFLEVV